MSPTPTKKAANKSPATTNTPRAYRVRKETIEMRRALDIERARHIIIGKVLAMDDKQVAATVVALTLSEVMPKVLNRMHEQKGRKR